MRDDELTLVTAAAVDFGHALGGAEKRLHGVFLDLPERHELGLAGGRLVLGVGGVIEGVVENFPETGGDGR